MGNYDCCSFWRTGIRNRPNLTIINAMLLKYLSTLILALLSFLFLNCESVNNDAQISNSILKEDSVKTKDTLELKKDTSYKSDISLKEDEMVDVNSINSTAPQIVESAYKNSKFNPHKWLKSDRSKYMLLHPGRISEYDKTIKKFARRYGFDWRLIAAQIYTESNFKNDATSHVGASGLMQIMPGTAKFMGYTAESMIDPDINIMVGCMYDQRMYDLWGRQTKDLEQRLAFAFASYNAGRGRVLKSYDSETGKITWRQVHPDLPIETQNYVHKIFLKYQYYKNKALP